MFAKWNELKAIKSSRLKSVCVSISNFLPIHAEILLTQYFCQSFSSDCHVALWVQIRRKNNQSIKIFIRRYGNIFGCHNSLVSLFWLYCFSSINEFFKLKLSVKHGFTVVPFALIKLITSWLIHNSRKFSGCWCG